MAQERIKIYDAQVGQRILVYADNPDLFPYTIRLQIDQTGLDTNKPMPEFVVLPGNEKRFVIATFYIKRNIPWKVNYKFQYMEGDANAVHNDDYVYQLPFKEGRYMMSQGYNGPSTHQGVNALDFTMPEGEIIVAARNGKVVMVKEDSDRGCPSDDCLTDGNFVRILHDDGTIAEYHHLQLNGAIVKLGDIVEQGQEIGKCGDTGYATGPHLHFTVFKTDGIRQITIKTKFKYQHNKIGFLKPGMMYSAF
ncbi:M23 family metallopeptidase [Roseivirga sp. E12]|uniref:M23 family metallopeptidase n=1 Tax=Roseivirga sp. E12 TaxID=2819237 RepID=UPI001ABC2923|nr:M23 family metallopeptidase [Roseivirga sp. E12]MBO3700474.1 M23 family metallopeptidase [Roseivirga sp. E12]